jgi:hypothetical protein
VSSIYQSISNDSQGRQCEPIAKGDCTPSSTDLGCCPTDCLSWLWTCLNSRRLLNTKMCSSSLLGRSAMPVSGTRIKTRELDMSIATADPSSRCSVLLVASVFIPQDVSEGDQHGVPKHVPKTLVQEEQLLPVDAVI